MSESAACPRIHFSVDDVFDSLIEVSDAATPLFEHPMFAFLRDLHTRYGVAIDLYLFLRQEVAGRPRALHDVTDRLRDELRDVDWLRFGPHALDYDMAPYQQSEEEQVEVFETIFDEIDRFAGVDRRSRWIRLHYFSEAYGVADFWRRHGVTTLLLTDKPAVAYHLDEAARARLGHDGSIQHAGLTLRRTHERVEVLTAAGLSESELQHRLDGHIDRHGAVVLFSHEVDLRDESVRAMCHACLRHAQQRGLSTF